MARIRNRWNIFVDLIPLSARKNLPLGVKARLYSASVNAISLAKHDARRVRSIWNIRPEYIMSVAELCNRLQLNTMKEYLQNRRLVSSFKKNERELLAW